MELRRSIILTLLMLGILVVGSVPCVAQSGGEEKKEDAWEGEPGGSRWGPGRTGMSDETIDKVIEALKKDNPAKAKELAELRKKDPEKFKAELRKHGGPYFAKIGRERWEERRRKWQEDFLKWLKEQRRKVSDDLAKLERSNPELYEKKLKIVQDSYRGIFSAWTRNRDLGEILLDDFDLKEKRDNILRKLRAEKDQKKKDALVKQLEQVVGQRFDLILEQKKIAYEHLLRRLEDLQKRIKESRNEMANWKKDKVRIVKKRLEEVVKGIPKIKWD